MEIALQNQVRALERQLAQANQVKVEAENHRLNERRRHEQEIKSRDDTIADLRTALNFNEVVVEELKQENQQLQQLVNHAKGEKI